MDCADKHWQVIKSSAALRRNWTRLSCGASHHNHSFPAGSKRTFLKDCEPLQISQKMFKPNCSKDPFPEEEE